MPKLAPTHSKVDKFFCSIRSVKVLVIKQHTAQKLMEEGFMHFLESFYNVRNLGVRISSDLDDKMIPSIVSLLRAVPNFTLDIRSPRDKVFFSGGPVESSFDSGHWQLQELDFINRIKEVTIEITDGSNGIEFAKYICAGEFS
ncbi:uncharacterized protein LOC133720105 [Rosa rugosa]|uniref:uncharacterized protein LOC133720105 n=1 Tax=Rosa rugosa TaxID=74645 RepID=UPI002B41679F|nr:uncharacterized protein LOC133720105 [Rosa rugosa]